MITSNILCTAVVALGLSGSTPEKQKQVCEYMSHIIKESEENNIKPSLMISLIFHESRFSPKAKSRAGACGLTQIIPKYTGSKKTRVPRMTCSELYDPYTSITMGARTLSFWYKTYGRGRDLKVALCGYNAGYRCKGKSPNVSGIKYARRVLSTAKKIDRKVKQLQSKNELMED